MNRARLAAPFLVAMLAATGGSAAFGQITRPGPLTPFNLFGANRAIPKARDATVNRHGNHPNLERKPPLKRIADPSNLLPIVPPSGGGGASPAGTTMVTTKASANVQGDPGVPQPEAIKVAAQIKTQEDLKGQKIKGLKYLGTIGCGCYAKKYDIEGAFLEALEDCTEEVRLEAARAILAAACADSCKVGGGDGGVCDKSNCCTKAIVAKLAEMAYKQDKQGCWVEPSARVRQAAVNALNACQPHLQPEEGGRGVEPGGTGGAPGTADPAPAPAPGTSRRSQTPPIPRTSQNTSSGSPFAITDNFLSPFTSKSSSTTNKASTSKASTSKPASAKAPVISPSAAAKLAKAAPKTLKGAVISVDHQKRLVKLEMANKQTVPVGTKLQVSHRYLAGPSVLTQVQVVDSAAGIATATPLDMTKFNKVSQGDSVVTID